MIKTLSDECNDFLNEFQNLPLYKFLPKAGEGFRKVKVRHKKDTSPIAKGFELATHDEYRNFLNRCVNSYNFIPKNEDQSLEPFFIFPTNGYKMLFSPTIKDYKLQFSELLKKIKDQLTEETTIFTIKDMVDLTYMRPRRIDFIEYDSEFLIYGIDYFYAIRCSLLENNYEKMLSKNYVIE